MIRLTLILTITLLFSLNIVTAQQNFLPGSVVENDNQTTEGFIDYRNWGTNPHVISFKKQLNGASTNFTPLQIKSFQVADEKYVSATVSSKILTDKIGDIEVNQKLKVKTDTVFLQALVEGHKSLYHAKNDAGINNFYINENENFQLLEYWKSYKRDDKGLRQLVEKKKYIGQLNLYLSDCSTIQSNLSSVKYTIKHLKQLFEKYYNCVNKDVAFSKKIEQAHFEFGILGGLTATTIQFKSASDLFFRFSEANFGPSLEPALGMYFDYVLPRNFNKWSISNDVYLTHFQHTGVYNDYTSEEIYRNYTTDLSLTYLKLYIQAMYKHPLNSKISIYGKAGVSNGYAISLTDTKMLERKFYTTETTETDTNSLQYRKYELGFSASLGATFDRYRVEAKFERGDGIFRNFYVGASSYRLYLSVGYSLFSKHP